MSITFINSRAFLVNKRIELLAACLHLKSSKMRFKILFCTLLFASTLIAQKLDYGLGLNFNAPLVQNSKTSFSSNGGYGAGLFVAYPTLNSDVSISNRVQLNRVSYFSPTLNSNINTDQFQLYFGFNHILSSMDSAALSFNFIPTYSNTSSIFRGKTTSGKPLSSNLNSEQEHVFDVGLRLGTEIRIAKNTGLELSYTRFIKSSYNKEVFDGQPNNISLSLNIHFSSMGIRTSAKKSMAKSLDSLSKDTLIVVNNACSRIMSNEVLFELFSLNYGFSAFKIINTEQLDSVMANTNTLFYALIGSYYGGFSEPESNGIYLMDRHYNLTEFPYPVHTMYVLGLGEKECFSSLTTTAFVIRKFNRRLFNSL